MTHTKVQSYEEVARLRRSIAPVDASQDAADTPLLRFFVSLCDSPTPSSAPPRVRLPTFFTPRALVAGLLIAIGIVLAGNGIFIRAKAAVAQVLLERAWEETIRTGQTTKAWSWADTWPIARISFPGLDRSAIVLAEGGGEALAFGPAHVAASPMPGEKGVSIIGGHRDTHFTFIKDLKPGDAIDVATRDGATVRYRMTGAAIVRANASGIETASDKPRLALVTCYPFDGVVRGPLRYVVFAEREVTSPEQ